MTTKAHLEDIYYANTNKGELTARRVISTIPNPNTLVIDVTQLSQATQETMLGLYQNYLEYADAYHKNIISFENWVAQTENITITPPWKALVSSHIIKQ